MTGQAGPLACDPWDRSLDRLCAAMGLLDEATPQFGDCQGVVGLGALLALPALTTTGLLDVAVKVYGGFGAAFYGVRSVFVCLSLMALLRVKRAEHLRHHSPPMLGRLLGLYRAPEVKTLRRKVKVLAGRKLSGQLQEQLARLRVEAHPDLMGFLYVDGHVRAYNGKIDLPKAHVTRMRLSMPATVDHWVNDRDGEPLLVLTATPTAALAKEMLAIAQEVKKVLGERRATIAFDRGGWSPKLFAALIAMGFDILTYRKGRIPKVRLARFKELKGEFDGREVSYLLAERKVSLKFKGGRITLREVVRLSENGKHQTSIVTNRKCEEIGNLEVAYRMFERWRQENFFKYMGDEFALDALVSYATEAADAERDVPNPDRRAKERALADARAEVAQVEGLLGAAVASNEESERPTMRGFKIANAKIGMRLRKAQAKVERLRMELSQIPKRVTANQAADGEPVLQLNTETKRLTDIVKMVAYQAETALFRMVRPHYARHEDEGRKLIASAMRLAGNIEVAASELRITLQPAASPNRTRAIAKLCDELNASNTIYPGTQLRLRYSIRET
jgi:prepilin-type processing-associated H-X9-DG protein